MTPAKSLGWLASRGTSPNASGPRRRWSRSREEFKDLFDNAPVGFHEIDAEGRLVRINNTELKLLGYSAGELLGQFVWKISADEEVSRGAALAQLAGEPPPPHDFERRLHRKDGTVIPVLINDRVLKGKDGAIIGIRSAIQDNTERKRAEGALAVERNLLRAVIDLLPDCIYAKDTSHRFLLGNEGCALLMGAAAPAELIGKTDANFYPSEVEANFRAEELSVFKGVPLINKAEPATRPDGTREFILTNKVPLKDGSGNIIGLVGCARFITERKRAEEALQREHNLLRTLIDQLPDYIYVRDFSNRFVVANESFARLMGVAGPSALIGKRDADFYPQEMAADFDKIDRAVFAGSPHFNQERVLRFPSGQELVTLNTKVPFKNDKGEVIGLIGVGRDITEIKRTEAALATEQRLLNSLITTIPDLIYFKDRESRFVRINEAFARRFGLSDPFAAMGKTDFDLFGEQHARAAYDDEQRILATGEPIIDKEEREDWKDGRVMWVSSTKMPLRDKTGKVVGIMGISRDITERKRLEEHLIQSQKMETVGKLAGGIAHEFNSILTAIIGQAELLREDLPAGSPLTENATAISQSADRAAILTRQLLAYGRKQFLRPEPLNLNQVITGMSGVLNHLMGGETVTVNIVPDTGLKLVRADAGQIEQVVMNLAMNARDAMPHGGRLTLETANVTIGPDDMGSHPELKPGGYAMLAVSDTGRGMSESIKAHAFEPFFTTKDVGQGTGLGLSTCYGIVKQSGGHINVYSEPGRGTTFKIYLPQAEPSSPKTPTGHPGAMELPRGTETILLVEDDPALREMAATLLRRLGYTVLAAANGVEALSLIQQRDTGHVDLLFTDVVMPHMSGRELADRVRALFPRTQILFTSAYTENAIVHQGVLDKGVALLQKPFTPSALARKVRETLD